MEPIGPIGNNSLRHIAPIRPVEPIGPIDINSTYRANWADGNNWPNWLQSIGTNCTNWAHGTNWPNWHTKYISRQLGRRNQLAQLALTHWDISNQLGPWNQLAQLAYIVHIALIGPMEPIGSIGINSLGQIAPIGPVEPIGPIGINSTYRANWADGTNWPN